MKDAPNHTYDEIFADATTYPSVFVFSKGNKPLEIKYGLIMSLELDQSRLNSGSWGFESSKILDLRDKINENGIKIKNIKGLKFFRGILTGFNEAFIIDENTKNKLINKDPKNKDIIKRIVRGKDLKRGYIDYKNLYLIFTKRGTVIDDYPIIKQYLMHYNERLVPKNDGQKIGRKPGRYKWYEIQDTVEYI